MENTGKDSRPEDYKAMFIPVDTRNLNDEEGKKYVFETAMAITAGLEEIGISREVIFFMVCFVYLESTQFNNFKPDPRK